MKVGVDECTAIHTCNTPYVKLDTLAITGVKFFHILYVVGNW